MGGAALRLRRRLRCPLLRGGRVLGAFAILRVKAVRLLLAVSPGCVRARLRLPFAGLNARGLGVVAADAKRGELLEERRAALGLGMLGRRLAAMRAHLVLRRQRQVLNLRHSLLPDSRRIGNKGP